MKLINDKAFIAELKSINKLKDKDEKMYFTLYGIEQILSKHLVEPTPWLEKEINRIYGLKDCENKYVGDVCQGCQELRYSCDCMSEKERNAYNQAIKDCGENETNKR
jgi:hypothetical protein